MLINTTCLHPGPLQSVIGDMVVVAAMVGTVVVETVVGVVVAEVVVDGMVVVKVVVVVTAGKLVVIIEATVWCTSFLALSL